MRPSSLTPPSSLAIAGAALLGLVLVGCRPEHFRSVQVPLAAATSTFPISLSSWLIDDHGHPIDPSRLTVVGQFEYRSKECAENADISSEVNRQVGAVGGEAIVRLELEARAEKLCVSTIARGDIVKVKPPAIALSESGR